MNLCACYLIKNEVDIIECNIRYHNKMGVKQFAIIENGSTDGTRELLSKLQSEFEIYIVDRPEHTYQFHQWRKEIVMIAKKIFNPDMTICCDADEFWLPADRNKDHLLTEFFNINDSIVTVDRFNMLPRQEVTDNTIFYDTDLCVRGTINYSKNTQIQKNNIGTLLSKIGPKIAVNPKGVLSINGGNHRGKHLRFWRNRYSQEVQVFHYPIRSFAHFENNVVNRKQVIDNPSLKIRIGDHYRRWAKLYEQNELRNEYNRFIFSIDEINTLNDIGVIQHDTSIGDFIRRKLEATTN